MWKIKAGFGAAVAAGAALLFAVNSGNSAGMFAYDDQDVVAQGRGLYEEFCASCHGANLEGQENWQVPDLEGYAPAPPHDETGHTWHHPDQQLFMTTKYGTEALVGGSYRSRMIGFEDVLSDDKIIAILSYIKSTWPDRIIERHNQMNQAKQ